MMHNWFECSIRYEKTMENGMQKKVTERYLVDALSFTEAEARIIEEMAPYITGGFIVVDIKRATYSELFPSDEESADRWFKCKLFFITLDEKSGVEKKTSTQVLVQAADLRDAVKKLDEAMKGTMADYQIAAVAETPIMDVYPYSEDEAGDEHRQPKEPTANELLSACRDGERTEVIVGGRKIIVDKRGRNTVVIPSDEENQKPNP